MASMGCGPKRVARALPRYLLVLLLLGVMLPTGTALPIEDDAGSGQDAPEGPLPEVLIQPDVVYQGNTTWLVDDEDWYAFEADGGQRMSALAFGSAFCFDVMYANGTNVDSTCSFEHGLTHTGQEAVLPESGIYFLRFLDYNGPHYRFSFALDGTPPDPAPFAAAADAPTGQTCPGAAAHELEATFGAGDASIPSLAWAALRTGFRAVIVWQTDDLVVGQLRVIGPDGDVTVLNETGPRLGHHFILDRLPVGDVLCFQVEYEGDDGPVTSSVHALRLRNAMNALDEETGVYSLNLLVVANENVYDRPTLEAGLQRYTEKLWDATDGHIRAGATIVVYGEPDLHQSGAFSCMVPSNTLQIGWPGCAAGADVVFVHEQDPAAAASTHRDGIQRPHSAVHMNALAEQPPGSTTLWNDPVNEVGSVLLHEIGHYAFGALDLYASATGAPDNCFDEATGISVMGSNRAATEFDDEVVRCPNEAEMTPGYYVPTWTLLRERFPAVPERPLGPVPGPTGDGGSLPIVTVANTPYADESSLPADDAGSGQDAPGGPVPEVWVEGGRVYEGNLTPPVLDEDWYAFNATAGQRLAVSMATSLYCLDVWDANGDEVESMCSMGLTKRVVVEALPESPHFFIRIFAEDAPRYSFGFALDATPPSVGGVVLPADDAGSGQDAPEGPTGEVPVEPGATYLGTLPWPVDDEDWFAFDAQAGQVLDARLFGPVLYCLRLFDDSGAEVPHDCQYDVSGTGQSTAVIPADGTYHLVVSALWEAAYRFAFELDDMPPDPSPAHVPQDDAGSGQDAPDGPVPEVWVEPGVVYDAAMLWPVDPADWFAFDAVAGDQVTVRAFAVFCPDVYDASGTEIESSCSGSIIDGTQMVDATLVGSGPFYLRFDGFAESAYRFSFALDGSAPEPALASVPQDDAGSGQDAPEGPVPEVWVEPGVVYDAAMLWPVDPADWFAFDAVAGDQVTVRVFTVFCPDVYDASGTEIESSCSGSTIDGTQMVEATLVGSGPFYLRFDGFAESPYRFSFALDGSAPDPALASVPQDDAGSGQDAPEGPTGEVPVEPGTLYLGSQPLVVDDGDWYAFDAQAGQVLDARLFGPALYCLRVFDDAGVEVPHDCEFDLSGTGRSTAVVPADGTYHLVLSALWGAAYRFAFELDDVAPDPSPIG